MSTTIKSLDELNKDYLTRVAIYSISSDQSIPDNSQTTILYTNKIENNTDISESGGVFTIGDGISKIRITSSLCYSYNTTGERRLLLFINNVGNIQGGVNKYIQSSSFSFNANIQGSSSIISVSQGDTIKVDTYQDSGGALSLLSSSGENWINIEVIK